MTTAVQTVSLSLSRETLLALDKDELDELFLHGNTPSLRELEGSCRGHFISGQPELGLNHPLGRRLLGLLTTSWYGKWFLSWGQMEGEGDNVFAAFGLQRHLMRFRTRQGAPLEGGRQVVVVDYDQPGNDPVLRRLRGDIRQVADNLYLGTLSTRWRGRYRFFSYFVLEKQS